MKTTPLWSPPENCLQTTQLGAFMGKINQNHRLSCKTYHDIHAFSVTNIEAFWSEAWDFMHVIGDKGEAPYFVRSDVFEKARFFPQAKLNFAENLLRRKDDGEALVFWGEDKVKTKTTWAQLQAQVSQAQQALRALGVGPGDRVAALMPNMPQTIIGMLATASIGAIWSSASPDFGAQGVLDRFGQIKPKVLIACDGYYYNGKTISIADKVAEIARALSSLAAVWIVPYLGREAEVAGQVAGGKAWTAALGEHTAKAVTFERLAFDHPLYILFSSGTTGAPKCIVHSAGGALLQLMKEHKFHCDLRKDERLFYFTTCGWMMWNWLVAGLSCEATLCLYDGSPFYPDGNILFDYADAEDFHVFGTSAKYIDSVKKADLRPRDTHSLKNVRLMTSTGSPLAPESFDFVYDAIKPDLQLASISGGTDICSCFVLGNPISPVYRGEIQGPGLGLAVDVFDAGGAPSHDKGELVCKEPFPAMPIGFWNDEDGQKYHNAYFARFPGVWHHGDFAEWTEHGGIVIVGRSDATLNPGGVRIGTAEIYAQVEQLEEVKESIAIGQDWDHDVRVVLFVVLREGANLNEVLINKIKTKIRTGASPRHVPSVIVAVPDIPRTKSGKITEIAVRDLVHGREVANKEALANPEALEHYKNIPALKAS